MNDLSERLTALSPEKRALLAHQVASAKGKAHKAQIRRQDRASHSFPLSFTQERMWFDHQWNPESPVYSDAIAIRIRGPLQANLLEKSLNEIVKRHEPFRTSFGHEGGGLVQIIAPPRWLTLPLIDLQHLSEHEREAEVRALAAEEAGRPFQLERGPLFRSSLIKLGPDEHVFISVFHHIIFDGWSGGILFNETFALYEAFFQRKPSPLTELSIQYVDFAIWQRNLLRDEILREQMQFWRDQLSGAPTILELPTDRPRPAVRSGRGAQESLTLSAQLTTELRQLGRREETTLFVTLLAAFYVLLYRWTGQEDMVVGSPVSSRNRAELEGLIGVFVNTLPLRARLRSDASFRDVLHSVRELTGAALAHRDIPFERLVEELQPNRDPSHTPIFQVMFDLQKPPRLESASAGLKLEVLRLHTGTAKFDLVLPMVETATELTGGLEYNTDIFDAATIQRMAGHFQNLLEGVVANPDQRISELPMLGHAEQHQLLIAWNDTEREFPGDRCLHQLFEDQAERTPQAIALAFEDRQLTYTQVNLRANQLADRLRGLGVGPEVMVGICLDRSPEMIIGLMGILKAGGATLPLDPSYPRQRLAFMLEQASVSIIVTQGHLTEKLQAPTARFVDPNPGQSISKREYGQNPISGVSPSHLAYVVFTSGSTGRPKGIILEHRAFSSLIDKAIEQFALGPGSRLLQFASFSFDASLWEIFAALCSGATLVLGRREDLMPGPGLLRLLREQEVTLALLSPSALTALPANDLPALQTIIAGTERCGGEVVDKWAPGRDFFNAYGPTETTVYCTLMTCQGRYPHGPPIGRPMPNMQTYILGPGLTPVPAGVIGQLHIGGVGMARGYLRSPSLTAAKFLPNSLSQTPGARMYTSGDLVRYLPAGDIEYLGRTDHQVKIRGFRIELGEIEAVLSQHRAVETALAVVSDVAPGDQRLVAYVVAKTDGHPADGSPAGAERQVEHIAQWEQLFDDTYRRSAPESEPTFNLIGWNDSYTGSSIPADEMRQWVDLTVERILSRNPDRVLEIGCGTGLLLFRIAPFCSLYHGADFSPQALLSIEQQMSATDRQWPQVQLSRRLADDFDGMPPGSFDTVILNSVVQYFPDIDYLVRVLERAVAATKAGGFIFVGDVRSLPLLEAFHASLHIHRAPDSLSCAQIRQQTQTSIHREEELVIDPAFFLALKQHLPQIQHVEIQLKRGHYHNELTRFRYDVILQVGSETIPDGHPRWLDWQQEGLTRDRLRQLLTETDSGLLGVRRIPNGRLRRERRILDLLAREDGPATVGALREALQQADDPPVIDPEDLWSLARDFPCSVQITWSGAYCFDALIRLPPPQTGSAGLPMVWPEPGQPKPWRAFANNPSRGHVARALVRQWQALLKKRLPDYMLPAAFVLVDALPLTPNGKLDRAALPAPDFSRDGLEARFVAPQTATEKVLAEMWAQVLEIAQVGIHDNFFDLGGHSLLATQLISRMRDAFSLEIPIRAMFQEPTVAGLGEYIDTVIWATEQPGDSAHTTDEDLEEGQL